MNFILYGLMAVCLLGLTNGASMVDLFAHKCKPTVDFKCDPNNEKSVELNGLVLQCPDDHTCNAQLMDQCQMCIKNSDDCYGQFTCEPQDLSKVIIENTTLTCPMYYKCNEKFVKPCDPCIMVPCSNTTSYSCDNRDPTKGKFNNMEFTCTAGSVCNKDNLQPCSPCITPEVGTTPLPEATTPPPVTNEDLPDCNDGYGATRACRPSKITNVEGGKEEKFYYRCNPVMWWYEVELVSCDGPNTDGLCKNFGELCGESN